jgi:hypothetical protein
VLGDARAKVSPLSARVAVAINLCAIACALTIAPDVRADDTPISRAGAYSPYELYAIHDAEEKLHSTIDPNPDGKTIERIETVRLDVIEKRDPVPDWIDIFHAKTRAYVVEREVLSHVGDLYNHLIADETARNLRGLSQLSLVVVVALKGSTPNSVLLVVITKDVWSLRLAWNVAVTPGGVESLEVQPSETNLAGTQQTVLADWLYDPKTNTFGLGYVAPRVDGRRLRLFADANVIIDHNGQVEGSLGAISIARPLFSTRTEWSWGIGASWADDVVRRFVNAHVATFNYLPTGQTTVPTIDQVPYEYREQRVTETAAFTRSFGWEHKRDFTFGIEFNRRAFMPTDTAGYDPAAVSDFEKLRVPVSDTRAGPVAQFHAYTANFVRVLDFDTLSLQEDYNVGYDFVARVYPITTALGSSRNFLGTFAGGRYTWGFEDALISAVAQSTVEAGGSSIPDASVAAQVHIVTPTLGFGRFVIDASGVDRFRNYLNRFSYLGGDTRLRGYPSSFYVGSDVFAANIEYRTRPIDILTVQLGAVAFYDAGDAFNSFSQFQLKHDVGAGLRFLFPQLDRVVFRADIAKPLVIDPGVGPVSFFVTFGQAFGAPGIGAGGATGTSGRVGAVDNAGEEDPDGVGTLGQ